MSKILESILNIALVVGCQIAVYAVFLRSKIMSWGALPEEAAIPLIGDELAPAISSTRAISIHAPMFATWKWIIQLGADRAGFFSYSFLERILGYEMPPVLPAPELQDMPIGRIIPGSIDESKSVIKYNFQVAAVEPGTAYVLKDWGAFVLREVDPKQTRLIVRTHRQSLPNLKSKIEDFFFMPLHYIMERRMMMGMKARVEGVRLSEAADNLWLLGVLLSGIGIALLIFLGQGIATILLSVIFGVAWLWVLLIFEPQPKYSLTLLLIEALTIIVNVTLMGK